MEKLGMSPAEKMGNNGERYVTHGDGLICEVAATERPKKGKGYGHADSVRDANARLIAAAPDLLEAANEMLSVCQLQGSDSMKTTLAMQKLRAAIAKAEGGGK